MSQTAVPVGQVRALLTEDRLRDALDVLLGHSAAALPRNHLLLLQAQLADLERDALLRTETPENLDIRRNQLRQSLLHCADLLEQNATAPAKDGIHLKKHAFRLLLAGKILLLLFIAFHFYIHAFSQGETLILLGLLSPVLIGYLLTALRSAASPALSTEARQHLPLLRGLVYVGLPLYFAVIVWIMRKVPLDEWAFETARNWIAGIELAFGGLVAYLVKTLFSEKN